MLLFLNGLAYAESLWYLGTRGILGGEGFLRVDIHDSLPA
jgi:hypothetical protein